MQNQDDEAGMAEVERVRRQVIATRERIRAIMAASNENEGFAGAIDIVLRSNQPIS